MNIPYIRSGGYFIPGLKLPEENRPIGKWGRMHRDYLKNTIQSSSTPLPYPVISGHTLPI